MKLSIIASAPRLRLRLSEVCTITAGLAAVIAFGGCTTTKTIIMAAPDGGDQGDDGGATVNGSGDDDGGQNEPPHALGSIVLGESHPSSGGQSTPFVSASFLPDSSALKKCVSSIGNCSITAAPKCTSATGATGCQAGEICSVDKNCTPSCTKACTKACDAGQVCALDPAGNPSCKPIESFDAGPIAFSGTTTPITLFPPYSYEPKTSGAPFLAGAQLEVQASGSANAGFAGFDEKFTATTFLQTSPQLSQLDRGTVFGTGSVPIGWVPGSDSITITASGGGGSASCSADDTSGKFDLPREVIQAVLGTASGSYLTITVSRQRLETKKDKQTKGTLSTATVQPVGWLNLTTTSTESAEFQGCPLANETACGQDCANLSTSFNHCGSCDVMCEVGQECLNGKCYGGGPPPPPQPDGGTSQACTTCETSAIGTTGACHTQAAACQADTQCTSYRSCMQACQPTDTTCQTNCQTQYPNGTNEFSALATCICGTACASPCATECAQ
jgi:hypothetical protein